MSLPVLIIDNYDSYTFNLYQLIYCENGGMAPVVLKNDDPALRAVVEARQLATYFGAIVISPGPGSAENAEDFGVNLSVIRDGGLPLLGVCLGHQGIGYAFGTQIVQAPEPMHGRSSLVYHCCGLERRSEATRSHHGRHGCIFEGLRNPFSVIRYHSLVIEHASLAACPALIRTGWTAEGISMGIQHATLPIYGIQFHPESIATEGGQQLMANFLRLARDWHAQQSVLQTQYRGFPMPALAAEPLPRAHGYRLMVHQVPVALAAQLDSEAVFGALYAGADLCYWLDSAKTEGPFGGRYSIMGQCEAATSSGCLLYEAVGRKLHYLQGDGRHHEWVMPAQHRHFMSWFQGLNRQWGYPAEPDAVALFPQPDDQPGSFVPDFGFRGGWIGLLGYELHEESLSKPHCLSRPPADGAGDGCLGADTIDAIWYFADRVLLFDHQQGHMYLISLFADEEPCQLHLSKVLSISLATRRASELWMHATLDKLCAIADRHAQQALLVTAPCFRYLEGTELEARCQTYCPLSPDGYAERVRACQTYITQGESYELCFTTKLQIPYADLATRDPLKHYLSLRRRNAAPFAFYFSLAALQVHLCSASPEELLRVTRLSQDKPVFQLKTKPIKGTARRDFLDPANDAALRRALKESVKDRSENLMIVDLVRHDLGSVASGGSVQVPLLFEVETYAVHQLVSTVTATLDAPKRDTLDAIWSAFPPGSMTGAPKQRSVRLLQGLESPVSRRGLYAGSAGWLSLDGAAGLNVIIRTAVFDRHGLELGAGGAIVHLSTPEQEYDEMILKASSVVRCLLFKE